jgi:hypothetical protein
LEGKDNNINSEKEESLVDKKIENQKADKVIKEEIKKENLEKIEEKKIEEEYKGLGTLNNLNNIEKEKEDYLGSFKKIDEDIKLEEDIKETEENTERKKEINKDFIDSRNLPPKPSVLKKILIRILIFFILLFFFITLLFSIYWFFILEDKNQPITDIIINIFNQFK